MDGGPGAVRAVPECVTAVLPLDWGPAPGQGAAPEAGKSPTQDFKSVFMTDTS